MKIGVISEGHADRAVISNILTGFDGIDIGDIIAIRPIYKYDETDKAAIDPRTFSNWSLVMEECKSREFIDGFLAFEGQEFIVIHLDTAEANQYGVASPVKNLDYCKELRNLVVQQINNWLGNNMADEILYAIAIEETDAWVLTIYENTDTSKYPNPKRRLKLILSKIGLDSSSNYRNFLELSENFSKRKIVKKQKYLERNESLKAFYDEIELKVVPKLEDDS